MHSGLRVIDPTLAAESMVTGDSPLPQREPQVLSAAIGKTGTRTSAAAARSAEDRGWL